MDCDRVLALSEAILQKARAGDWEGAIALEAERAPLLRARHPAVELAERILALDREVVELGEALRAGLACALADRALIKQAVSAYCETAADD